ncbi:hypothetical protein [Nonomuraea zeae]|nr:hypothetical protein [Nonomuraea zeae]
MLGEAEFGGHLVQLGENAVGQQGPVAGGEPAQQVGRSVAPISPWRW